MSAPAGTAGTDNRRASPPVALAERFITWDGDPRKGVAPVVVDRTGSATEVRRVVADLRRRVPDGVVGAVCGIDHERGGDLFVDEAWVAVLAAAAGVDRGRNRRVFTGDTTPTSLRSLRRWVELHLVGQPAPGVSSADPDRVADIVLVTSELATNVERHARAWLTVDLVDLGGCALVAVTDPVTDRLPVQRTVSPEEISGRGLQVVSSLSLAWGVVVRPESKSVWAALPL